MRLTCIAARTAAAFAALSIAAASPAVAAGPLGSGDRDPLKLIKQADADRDGRVTRAEFTAERRRLFDRLDRNRDDYVSGDDLPRRAKRRGGGERLATLKGQFDRNGDGRISRSEFVDGPSAFDRLDADQDGVVTRAEIDRAEQAIAPHRP